VRSDRQTCADRRLGTSGGLLEPRTPALPVLCLRCSLQHQNRARLDSFSVFWLALGGACVRLTRQQCGHASRHVNGPPCMVFIPAGLVSSLKQHLWLAQSLRKKLPPMMAMAVNSCLHRPVQATNPPWCSGSWEAEPGQSCWSDAEELQVGHKSGLFHAKQERSAECAAQWSVDGAQAATRDTSSGYPEPIDGAIAPTSGSKTVR